MPGKQPNWDNEKLKHAAKEIIKQYYAGNIENRWQAEIEFFKLTGFHARFTTIFKHAEDGNGNIK